LELRLNQENLVSQIQYQYINIPISNLDACAGRVRTHTVYPVRCVALHCFKSPRQS